MDKKNIPPTRASLEKAFADCGCPLSPRQAEQFWQLHLALSARNEADDLTRIEGFYNLLYKHYIDGAVAAGLISPQGLTMDLGTGAGFPGLPLAIMRPDRPLLLAEPRGKRLAFMEEMVEALELPKVEFYPHKVGPGFNRPINNFITRDFESAADSLVRAAQILPPGGEAYLMKGPQVDRELTEAREKPEWAEFEQVGDLAYELGDSGIRRRLITWRKKEGASRPAPPPPYRVVEIASRENPRYKAWLKILSGRGLKKSDQAIISGRKFVAEILAARPEKAAGLIARRPSDLEGLTVPPGVTVHLVRPELFPALDLFGSGPPLLLLKTPQLPLWAADALPPGLTVFLPFQDPANLGAAIRTAAAVGAEVVLLKEAASPWHPKSLRASGPSVLAVELKEGPPLAELAQLNWPNLWALSPRGENILRASLPRQAGFVFGIEGPGLAGLWPESRCLSIPMKDGVESLNAAAALAFSLGVWAARLDN